MLIESFEPGGRTPHRKTLQVDLTVVGGGLAGLCCSITAARQGLRVVLIQDRPVLGGNASSEVRLWALGATSHMGNNNRWAREGGVIDEILVENLWRNPEGNPVLVDALLLEWVTREPNITLLLNTSVLSVEKNESGAIASVGAYCSQNETEYTVSARLFCDASGDGVIGYLAGAAFRLGAEASSEFGEGLAGPEPTLELLGHSLYFYSRDTGKPVTYVPPSFALRDIREIPRYRQLRVTDSGCNLWWLEYGGHMDTVHGTEEIKWELWRVAYGVWNYIKNSGDFPEAANLTLEWMGMIPGKRESRRFEGDYMLRQQDIVEQRAHYDAVSLGGWAIDIHPAGGVYSAAPACMQWHAKGVYQVPFRTMFSRNIPNLFLAGRILSASHIAFGSIRTMLTCAHNGQAVGMAAAICTEHSISPRDVADPKHITRLQQRLINCGQYIPGVVSADPADLVRNAHFVASSTLVLAHLEPSSETRSLDAPCAVMLPMCSGAVPTISLVLDVEKQSTLTLELWKALHPGNGTPDVRLASASVDLQAGRNLTAEFHFVYDLETSGHVFLIISPVEGVAVHVSQQMLPGVLTLWQKMNRMVAKSSIQSPPVGSGIDTFAFWLPERRPAARNLAISASPPIRCYEPSLVANGIARPFDGANAWAPAGDDPVPWLRISWPQPQTITKIEIVFDTDFDHPMESVLMGHPERVMPGCVRKFEVRTVEGVALAFVGEHHQTRWHLSLPNAVITCGIELVIHERGLAPPAIFEVRCY
jgi:hypothetical protein